MQLDINVTSTCNLGCLYCSEGHNPNEPDLSVIENSKTNVPKEDIIKLVQNVHSEKPEEPVNIAFWGGEPMMNMQYCTELMLHFKDDKRVSFFFYTNGMYIKKNKEKLNSINSLLDGRLEIQVSYDGKAVNDVERLTKQGKSTSEEVKESFSILQEIGIKSSVKSTITPRTFKYIFEAYLDVISMGSNYFPTPDSYEDYDNPDEHYVDLIKGLQKIAKHIYDNGLDPETFGWFQQSRALCQAGVNYFAVNLDGDLSPCHGTMYEDSGAHIVGNISDADVMQEMEEATVLYSGLMQHMNDDCNACESLFCMKCPAGAFSVPSTIAAAEHKGQDFVNGFLSDEYDLRWTTKNINMCTVFKINDKIHKSLLYSIQKGK